MTPTRTQPDGGTGERLASLALLLVSALCVVLIAWILWRRWNDIESVQDMKEVILIYLLPLGLAAAGSAAVALSGRLSSALTLVYGAAALCAFLAAELYLEIATYDYNAKVVRSAKRHGIDAPDLRSAYRVAREMRRTDPGVHPFFRFLEPQKPGGVVPLGNTPNRTIVYCNEMGRFLIFRSDRHGYNNPDSVWDKENNSVALLGDSFAHGACDPQNRGFANILRDTYPDLLNVATGGNDPLTNLAALVEYAVKRRPGVVIWAHYAGNDLIGLEGRKKNPLLRQYATAGFSQNLYERRGEVEAAMAEFFGRVVEPAMQQGNERPGLWQQIDLVSMLKLKFLRYRLGLTKQLRETVDWELYEQIMLRARHETESIGARLIVVSLPDAYQVLRQDISDWEKRSFEILDRLGIEHHDLWPVLRKLPDPSTAYSFGPDGGHFSPAGSRIAADTIRAIIEQRAVPK